MIAPKSLKIAVVRDIIVHVTVPSTTVFPTTLPTMLGAATSVVPATVHFQTVVPVDHNAHVFTVYAVIFALVVDFAPPA